MADQQQHPGLPASPGAMAVTSAINRLPTLNDEQLTRLVAAVAVERYRRKQEASHG